LQIIPPVALEGLVASCEEIIIYLIATDDDPIGSHSNVLDVPRDIRDATNIQIAKICTIAGIQNLDTEAVGASRHQHSLYLIAIAIGNGSIRKCPRVRKIGRNGIHVLRELPIPLKLGVRGR
jgi:hypothetical protein